VLLFDEPLSNLDARLRRQMRDEIRALQRRLGITVVYVTHDQEEALGVSDRIIVMNHAVVAQEGPPRDLYESPDDVFVAGFMGEANRVKGVLQRLDERTGRVTIGGLTRILPHRGLADGTVDVAIRPEAILIAGGPPAHEALRGTVSQAAYLGARMEYSITSEIGELFVTSPAVDTPLAPGATVALTLAGHGITLIRP
jgi:iron(III) transport system ATP-binding protein